MRNQKLIALFGAMSLAAAMLSGCPGDPEPLPDPVPGRDGGTTDAGTGTDAGNNQTDAGSDAGTGSQEFTTFVRGEIVNRTSPNTAPATIDDKTFTDSQNPNAFETAFFQ